MSKKKNKQHENKETEPQKQKEESSIVESAADSEDRNSIDSQAENQTRKEKATVDKTEKILTEREEKISELTAELGNERDKRLRTLAEYDNFRRRTQTEYRNMIQLAGERIILQLLPVMDDFQRLFNQDSKNFGNNDLLQGVKLIYQKVENILSVEGVKPIDVESQSFDAELHEAVAQIEDTSKPAGAVVAEVERGYRLADRIIRHPKVIVNSITVKEQEENNE